MRKLIVSWKKQEPLALVAERVGKKWPGHRLDSEGTAVGTMGSRNDIAKLINKGANLVWAWVWFEVCTWADVLILSNGWQAHQLATGRRPQGHQSGHIHTCITTGSSSQLSTLHSANKFGLAKGDGWRGRCAGGWCYERGIYGVLPIGQSQTVLKMAKGLDQRFSHAPTERISQPAAL